ncbi:flagellin [Marinobacter sp. NFXS11]|uniref:flagellin N-terminal helical domain-containing protein n=1 Tax=Marinobacter sp. NFXS11 TaxID=2818432 RepID=UPI0032DFDE97
MPQVINTNIASLNAQRNLNASQGQANVALERLSSGLRINSAKDDAAGLAISERFQSQIAGLNQAQRNANDGISLAQTAEGAMDEITNNLQRIRELAVQSANATNSPSDRQALNQEVQQRIEEINRIAAQTSFNGLKVLDGTFDTQTFQVGANTGETIAISGLDSRGSQIGSVLKETAGLSSDIIGPGEAATTDLNVSTLDFTTDLTITGTIGGEDVSIGAASYADADALATALQTEIQNGGGDLAEVTVTVDGNTLTITNPTSTDLAVSSFSITDAAGSAGTTASRTNGGAITDSGGTDTIDISTGFDFTNGGTITIGGGTPVTIADGASAADIAAQLDTELGADLDVTESGGTITITNPAGGAGDTDPGTIVIEDGTGTPNNSVGGALASINGAEDLTLGQSFANGDTYNFEVDINGDVFTFEGMGSLSDIVSQINAQSTQTGIRANLNSDNDEIIFSSQFGEAFDITIDADIDGDGIFGGVDDYNQAVNATIADDTYAVTGVDISSRDGADLAMISIDYAIDTINGYRAELGAVQNRFESTIANLATTSENLSASNSRIRDADFAAESAELARTQVLQQAGLSVLAQANARPQQVLQLLQG